MGLISEKTERDPITGQEFFPCIYGGSDYKAQVTNLYDYISGRISNALDKIVVTDLGTKSVDFSISMQEGGVDIVTLDTAREYTITFVGIAKVVKIIEIRATAAVTFDYAQYMVSPVIFKWADGYVLESLASGEVVRLHVSCNGDNKLVMNWIKFVEVTH